ncbi:MAG: hypothetical protein K2M79_05890 [Muribaculaceae bacterium]|nr:hypothetical protein [Muribaculaceae bacterium]
MRFVTIVVLVLLGGFTVYARRVRGRQPVKAEHIRASLAKEAEADTVQCLIPAAGELVVSGFDKLLNARKESFFITNTGSECVHEVTITVTYLDTDGRMLHKAQHSLTLDLPVGETRRVQIPSFDTQGVFYYYLSDVPRTRRAATPFKVKITVDSYKVR